MCNRNFLAIFAILAANLSPLYSDELDAEVNAALAKGREAKHWKAKDANLKEQVVIRLRNLMDDKRDASDSFRWREPARVALLGIGDELAIKDTMEQYAGRGWHRMKMGKIMKQTHQLSLVPLLAKDLASDEPANRLRAEGEFLMGPRSVTSSDVICSIVANSNEIRLEVKNWIRRWSAQRPEELLSQMRLFWSKNASAFAKKDYASVAVPD
jgi:hypothetical protein